MTDLSKIPDLELRQKVNAIKAEIDAVEDAIDKISEPLRVKRVELNRQLSELLGERWITGTCDETDLPIFDDDETYETRTLACLDA